MTDADLPQLLKSATSGDEDAIQDLLTCFEEQSLSEVEQEQVHLFVKQASRHTPAAIYLRGLLFERGFGVKSDLDMAFLLMREAAAKGNSQATLEVGRHYLSGIGVEKNAESALQWLTIAAGSPHYLGAAMLEIGKMYDEGLGVSQDNGKAQAWFDQAAKKGYFPTEN